EQELWFTNLNSGHEPISLRVKAYFEAAMLPAHGDASAVAAFLHNLHTWHTTWSQKVQDCLPGIGGPEVEVEQVMVCAVNFLLSRQMPDLGRGTVEGLADSRVKPANAPKARHHRNLIHGQAGFI